MNKSLEILKRKKLGKEIWKGSQKRCESIVNSLVFCEKEMKINNKKVVIVGAGAVGSTYAHNLVVDDLADEIAIINTNKSKASANSLDLLHALAYLNSAPKNIYAADYADVADADIVVLSANAP